MISATEKTAQLFLFFSRYKNAVQIAFLQLLTQFAAINFVCLLPVLLVCSRNISGVYYKYLPVEMLQSSCNPVATTPGLIATVHFMTWKIFLDVFLKAHRIWRHSDGLKIKKVCFKMNNPAFLVHIHTNE